jgi:PAS domain S-box-containing protein
MTDTAPAVAALADVDEAVVVVDSDGVVVAMSDLAQQLAGVTAEDLVGEFVEMLVPDPLRWGHQRYRRGFLAEPSAREMDPGLGPRVQRPDGTLVPIAVRLVPHQHDGRLYVAAHLTERE